MDYLNDLIHTYGLLTITLIAISGFIAGFIDAIVGGGGLIQVPFLLIIFPTMPLPVLFGTNKIAALSGTSISAMRYAQKISFNWKLLLSISAAAFLASFIGARTVSYINTNLLKPVILIILILIAAYTFIKKDLGQVKVKELPLKKQILYGSLIGMVVGFYDGFFGPGTGSFFVLGFVMVLGFEFVQASAYAKLVNCVTNISALVVFIMQGYFIFPLAVLMAIFNITGSYLGSSMALKKGNGFVRIVFLLIVSLMILRYGFDIIRQYLNA